MNDKKLRSLSCDQLGALHGEAMQRWENAIHAFKKNSDKFGKEPTRIERVMKEKECMPCWTE